MRSFPETDHVSARADDQVAGKVCCPNFQNLLFKTVVEEVKEDGFSEHVPNTPSLWCPN